MPDPKPLLDYAPAPPLARERRILRRMLTWLGAGLLALAMFHYLPAAWRQAWYLGGQRKCMAFSFPTDQLAYANDPADATALLAKGYKPVASAVGQILGPSPGATMSAGRALDPLAEVGEETLGYYANTGAGYVRQGVSNAPMRTGAFLHARHYAHGEERLVGVVFLERQVPPSGDRLLEINALVWRPGTWELGSRLELAGLSTLVFTRLDHRRVRIYCGQVDAADASHFMLAYDIDGESGTIDGWLDPFDRVRLQVRDGPALGEAETAR